MYFSVFVCVCVWKYTPWFIMGIGWEWRGSGNAGASTWPNPARNIVHSIISHLILSSETWNWFIFTSNSGNYRVDSHRNWWKMMGKCSRIGCEWFDMHLRFGLARPGCVLYCIYTRLMRRTWVVLIPAGGRWRHGPSPAACWPAAPISVRSRFQPIINAAAAVSLLLLLLPLLLLLLLLRLVLVLVLLVVMFLFLSSWKKAEEQQTNRRPPNGISNQLANICTVHFPAIW